MSRIFIEEILIARNVKFQRISFYVIFLHQHYPKKRNIHYSYICEEYLRQEDLTSVDVIDIHWRNIETKHVKFQRISFYAILLHQHSPKKRSIHYSYMWRMFAPGRSCISRCQGYSSKEGSAFLMWALAKQCYFGAKPWWISFYLSVKKSILLAILFMTLVWLPMSWCEAVQGLHCKPMSFQRKILMNIIRMFLLQLNNIDSTQFNQSIPASASPKSSVSKPTLLCFFYMWYFKMC